MRKACKLHPNKHGYEEQIIPPHPKLASILTGEDNQGTDIQPPAVPLAILVSTSTCQLVSTHARDNEDSIWFLKI